MTALSGRQPHSRTPKSTRNSSDLPRLDHADRPQGSVRCRLPSPTVRSSSRSITRSTLDPRTVVCSAVSRAASWMSSRPCRTRPRQPPQVFITRSFRSPTSPKQSQPREAEGGRIDRECPEADLVIQFRLLLLTASVAEKVLVDVFPLFLAGRQGATRFAGDGHTTAAVRGCTFRFTAKARIHAPHNHICCSAIKALIALVRPISGRNSKPRQRVREAREAMNGLEERPWWHHARRPRQQLDLPGW